MARNNNQKQQVVRLDAAVSYFIESKHELESMDPRKFRQLVPGIVGRRIFSSVQGLTRSQPVYSYEMQTLKARTRRSAGKAKDAPTVEVVREKVSHTIETYRASVDYELDDVENARINGNDLPGDKRLAAVTTLEEKFDAAIAVGDGDFEGAANNSDIDATVAGAKTGGGTKAWTNATATADEMLKDVANAVSDTTADLKQARVPGSDMPMFNQWSLVLPESWYVKAATTYRTNTDTSALEMIQRMPFIKAVVPWWRMETADAGAARAALYPALDNGAINPMAVGIILPIDYEEFAPEVHGGEHIVIPVRGKCGGAAIPYPVACRYIDIS